MITRHYTDSLGRENAAQMTRREVADLPGRTGPAAPVRIPADPFLDPAGADAPAPF